MPGLETSRSRKPAGHLPFSLGLGKAISVNWRHLPYAVALVFGLIGLALTAWHMQTRSHPAIRPGDTFWQLRYEVDFTAGAAGAKVRLSLPGRSRFVRVYRQEVSAPGLVIRRIRPAGSSGPEILLSASQPGSYRVRVELELHRPVRPFGGGLRVSSAGSEQQLASYLQSEPMISLDHPVVQEVLQQFQVPVRSKISLVGRIFDFCTLHLRPAGPKGPQDAAAVLASRQAGPGGRCRAMVALCRQAGIPARLVTGFVFYRGAEHRPRMWVEVWTGVRWESYDPESAMGREMTAWRIPVRYGSGRLVRSQNVAQLQSRFSLLPIAPPEESLPNVETAWTDLFDLTRLPVEMHSAMAVLLLMPLGALVTSVFRTVVGIATLGTFTPALLALSFLYADWQAGLIILAAVLGIGLMSRGPLDRLKLLLVPRLSVMLTLVVLTMVGVVSVLDYTGWTPGPEAVLLPMVIMTMAIERFYLHMEEDGLASAGKLLLGTAVVALCCYGVLQWRTLGRFLLKYPESHFLTMAGMILVGRYTGYRLSELWRFRDFVE